MSKLLVSEVFQAQTHSGQNNCNTLCQCFCTIMTDKEVTADEMEEVAVEPEDESPLDVWSLLAKKKETVNVTMATDPKEVIPDGSDTEPPSPSDFELRLSADLQVKLENIEKNGSITGLLQCTDEESLGYNNQFFHLIVFDALVCFCIQIVIFFF